MPNEIPVTPSVTPGSGNGPRGGNKTTRLHDDITSFYVMIGMGAVGIGGTTGDEGIRGTGEAIVLRSGNIADAWIELAQKNPKVKNILENFTSASSIGGVVGVHVMVALPFLIDRKMVPDMVGAIFAPTPDAPPENPAQ